MQKWCVQLEAAAALALLRCTSKLGAPFCTRTIKDNEDFRPPLAVQSERSMLLLLCQCVDGKMRMQCYCQTWSGFTTPFQDDRSSKNNSPRDPAFFLLFRTSHSVKGESTWYILWKLTLILYFQRFKKTILFLYPPDMLLLPLLVFALLSGRLLKSCTRVANNHVCFLATNMCLCVYGKFFEEPA